MPTAHVIPRSFCGPTDLGASCMCADARKGGAAEKYTTKTACHLMVVGLTATCAAAAAAVATARRSRSRTCSWKKRAKLAGVESSSVTSRNRKSNSYYHYHRHILIILCLFIVICRHKISIGLYMQPRQTSLRGRRQTGSCFRT